MPRLHLIREQLPGPPHLDTAIARAIVERVATGGLPPTLVLSGAKRVVAFGRQDAVRPGYPSAVAAAESEGFAAVERLAGGRAAVFHEGTLSFSWAIQDTEPRTGIAARFAATTEILIEAFRALGTDARVGRVPGEYCPGDHSINLGGTRKVMGVGQRLIRGAAHVGGVIVVDRADLVNRPLTGVYRALGYDWDPDATGALDEQAPGLSVADVAQSIETALASRYRLVEAVIDTEILDRAGAVAAEHLPRIA